MPEHTPQQSARRWKRMVKFALLLLAGGAVVNVAVAWGSALASSESLEEFVDGVTSGDVPAWYIREQRGWTRRDVAAAYLSDSVMHAAMQMPTGVLDDEHAQRLLRIIDEMCSGLSDNGRCFARFHGWPAFSLRCSRFGAVDFSTGRFATVFLRGGIHVGKDPRDAGPSPILPYQPIAPGFTLNTLFYALLLWLLFFAPFSARRMLRRRRGQCEKCAYPIGVSPVCTECGAAVRPLVARSS